MFVLHWEGCGAETGGYATYEEWDDAAKSLGWLVGEDSVLCALCWGNATRSELLIAVAASPQLESVYPRSRTRKNPMITLALDKTPAPHPGPWQRRLLRAPLWLYRARLGWLLGNRFLLLTHHGRRTGRLHQTVLEVVRYDSEIPEWTVVSGFGPSSDWFRNITQAPASRIHVGRADFVPEQRILTEAECRRLLAGYQQQHPRAARVLSRRLLGAPFDGSPESINQLAATMPSVAFRPRLEPSM
jgi:deazaflavin-dependent oxidoreductase (nitroreductase family)